jgi:hypothetical protein
LTTRSRRKRRYGSKFSTLTRNSWISMAPLPATLSQSRRLF